MRLQQYTRNRSTRIRRAYWTAEEYDKIEQLTALGLPPFRIARLLEPPTTANAVKLAMARAGFERAGRAGRPSKEAHRRWDEIEESLRADEL